MKIDLSATPKEVDINKDTKKPKKSSETTKDVNMHISDQAVGALMMALQKSLMEQSDIVPVIKGFKFRNSEAGLMVMNPPLVKFGNEEGE
jgi:hypothetical protein